jgi:DNA-binding NtrC family response regulator
MQVRLLRAIQERRITRVGGETAIPIEFRLFCATHRDLRQLVEEGRFREDLFYRVNVIQLRVPPLRERREDILWFARRFLAELARRHGEPPRTLHPEAEHALLCYAWPGNVRELKHCVERACILSEGSSVLTPDAFFDETLCGDDHPLPDRRTLGARLEQAERELIVQGLERNRWQIGLTAAELGISRKNLWEKMKKLHIGSPLHPR